MLIVCFSVFLPPTGPNSSTMALKRCLQICLINNPSAKSFCVSCELTSYLRIFDFTFEVYSLHPHSEWILKLDYAARTQNYTRVDTFPSMWSVQQSWRIAAVLHYRTHNLVLWCWGREYRLSSSGKAWNRQRSSQNIFFKRLWHF